MTNVMEDRKAVRGICCRDLTFKRSGDHRDGMTILDGIEAEFECGRIALVSGETGAGKSTLIHVLAGLLRPTGGQVVTGQGAVSRFTAPHRDRWRRQVGIVFQDLRLMGDLTVLENLMVSAVPRMASWPAMVRAARTMLDRTDLATFSHRPVNRLSGGQRQRVAVARALMGAPQYLFLDEPTAFQDDGHVQDLLALWDRCAGQGACVVVCSHDVRLKQASSIHRRWVLDSGRLERLP